MPWPRVIAGGRCFHALHRDECRDVEDGRVCFEAALPDDGVVRRSRTERIVPVPTVFDAIGQHTVARILRRAGYTHHGDDDRQEASER